MPKRVIFVIGASGNIGASTVASLSARAPKNVEIRAGVRNPDKADNIKSIAGVTVVQATMGDEKLVQTLTEVHTLYIVTPGVEKRVQLTLSTAWLAKTAGVKYIAVVSVLTADLFHTKFGRHFTEIEVKISGMGVPCTFIRLPLFTELYWAFRDAIASQGTIYCPCDPEKPFTTITVEDAGSASAAILLNPSPHSNKKVTVVSERQTFGKVAEEFSAALGKEVKYARVPYEDAKKSFLEMGFPEWQVDGILELYKQIDSSNPLMSNSDVEFFTAVTKTQPTDLKKWLAKRAESFQ